MKLVRLGEPGREIPAVVAVNNAGLEEVFDVRSMVSDFDGNFLASDGIDRIRRGLAQDRFPVLEGADQMRLGTPVVRPGNLVCVGLNYAAHAAESGVPAPTVPVVFLKPANTAAGPFDATPIPPASRKYDWEVELGVVIGRSASYLASPADAMDVVAGYVVGNDLSERDYQLNGPAGQWTKGKSLPLSTPLGPWLVPADEVDASRLRLRSWVNGEPRQDSSTADLIFDVPTVVHHLSQYMLLEPGDVILTGTPEGVALSGRFPYLQDGDVFEAEIEGLGRQRQVYFRAETGISGAGQFTAAGVSGSAG
jgi:2,4-didehydro-3-deoxy-L-rhamnonate hydrolase